MSITYQPKKKKRAGKHGFLVRQRTKGGKRRFPAAGGKEDISFQYKDFGRVLGILISVFLAILNT